MSKPKDPSPIMHDPKTQSEQNLSYRIELENYINESPGSWTEKMENFCKYVPRQALARFLARYELFKIVQNVQGSIVECGVMFGGGLMAYAQISSILEPYNFQRKIIGFDTFSGFPKISEQDKAGVPEKKAGHLRVGGLAAIGAREDLDGSIGLFDQNRYLSHLSKVELVQGDFLKTGPKYLEDNPHLIVSCLYLDFDLYEPAKLALQIFYPRIPKGGILAFDQLNEEMYPGESIALLEELSLSTLKIKRFPFDPRISYVVIGE